METTPRLYIEMMPLQWCYEHRHERNPKSHDIGAISTSYDEFGYVEPIVMDERTQKVAAGHGRIETLVIWRNQKLKPPMNVEVGPDGDWLVPVVRGNHFKNDAALRAYLVASNRLTALGGWDEPALVALLTELQAEDDALMRATGFDGDDLSWLIEDLSGQTPPPGDPPAPPPERPTLADRFGVPPFSVLDARQGYWQARKQRWIAIGIQSELGRGNENLGQSHPYTTENRDFYTKKEKLEQELGRTLETREAGDILLERGLITDPREANKNGLLGFSEQARSHYNAAPGGSARPATSLGPDGKTQRGDGHGRAMKNGKTAARTFGQDLMRGEHTVGGALDHGDTWVKGNPRRDEVSHKILAAGPKNHVGGLLMTSDSGNDPEYYAKKQAVERQLGRELTTAEFQQFYYDGPDTYQSGTSIFDPVLCELAYRWFTPADGSILDPFAGGSVRGIVAALTAKNLALEAAMMRHQAAFAEIASPVHLFHLDDQRHDFLTWRHRRQARNIDLSAPIPDLDRLRERLLDIIGYEPAYQVVGRPLQDGGLRIRPIGNPRDMLEKAQVLAWAYLESKPGHPVFPFWTEHS